MSSFGQSIRIYLSDGTVTGIKFGEIVNKTTQSISCPRLRTSELNTYPESKKPDVYTNSICIIFQNNHAKPRWSKGAEDIIGLFCICKWIKSPLCQAKRPIKRMYTPVFEVFTAN